MELAQKETMVPNSYRQRTFRGLLAAISRPGTVLNLPRVELAVGRPHLALVALTLLDREVGFAVADPAYHEFQKDVAFLTGAAVRSFLEADYFFGPGGRRLAELVGLPLGTLEYPDRGATAVLQVADLSVDRPQSPHIGVVLNGPGITSRRNLFVTGLHPANLEVFAVRNREFPLGLDLFLVSETGRVVGLPRTVELKWEEAG